MKYCLQMWFPGVSHELDKVLDTVCHV
ncbi:hypothetical protein RDI58_026648 [Solanum bulbocastanum]|uniref:Uncharacterized protein n=1 Tax=Solanum bulbocastanum TaxID=147425 RepID=A0AAN8Y1M7_SOLBU